MNVLPSPIQDASSREDPVTVSLSAARDIFSADGLPPPRGGNDDQRPALSTGASCWRGESIEEHVRQLLDELDQLARALDDQGSYEADLTPLPLPEGFLLSIVIPVYNEVSTIRQVVARLLAVPVPHEVLIIDDGSEDGTSREIDRLAAIPNLRIFLKPVNEGKGAAVRHGLWHARGDVIMVQDADLEYDPRDIPRLLAPIILGQADVVFGSRFLEPGARGSSWIHRLGNRLLTALSNRMTGLTLTDMETCYKVFRRQAVEGLVIEENRFGFEPEITAKLARRGARIVEVPVRYRARRWQDGKKIGTRDALSALRCIVRYARK